MKRALVVDDDPVMGMMVARALETLRMDVSVCREAEAAEAMIENTPMDVMVVDLCLSALGGFQGLRLTQHVNAQFPSTRVVVLSGHVTESLRELCHQMGARGVFPKPVELPLLCKLVQILVGASPDGEGEPRIREVEPLDEVLARGCVTSLLQPIVRLDADGPPFTLLGTESLARGPAGTLLQNPQLLFGYAAKKDAVFELDMQCIRAALAEAAAVEHDGLHFINTHPLSLSHPAFARCLTRAAAEADVAPSRIVLEITEHEMVRDPGAFSRAMDDLRGQGFRTALDDYGVGFSNLELLLRLRPDYLKLAGVFCRNLASDDRVRRVLRSTAELARDLGIPTILEQVETGADADTARETGMDHGQGYFYARPSRGAELARSGRFLGLRPRAPEPVTAGTGAR